MNPESYSLSEGYVTVGTNVHQKVDDMIKKYVAGHYLIAFAIILVLVIVVLYLLYKSKESFMPGDTMRMQSRDDRMTSSPSSVNPNGSYFTQAGGQNVADGISIPTFNPDPNAAPGQPGSLSYLVLNSPDMACSTRTPVGTDAWSWMTTNIGPSGPSEGFTANDNKLSKIMAGQ